eukprot:g315.t1
MGANNSTTNSENFIDEVENLVNEQGAKTTGMIIDLLKDYESFTALAKGQAELLLKRDQEDDAKLGVGIDAAIEKGILKELPEIEYTVVNVAGKTPDAVADEILESVGKDAADQGGEIIVLAGLSGTGKGTTMKKLKEKIPNGINWSNGNIFRSLTLLAYTYVDTALSEATDLADETAKEAKKKELWDTALNDENLKSFMEALTFEKNEDGKWDTHIKAQVKAEGITLHSNCCKVYPGSRRLLLCRCM